MCATALSLLAVEARKSNRGILTTNFFSYFKWKLVHLRRYDSRRAAQADLFAYTTKIKKTAFRAPTRRAVPGCPSEGVS